MNKIMSIAKTIWKNLATRIWLIVTAVLLILILAVGIVATQVPLIFGTLRLALGDYRYERVEKQYERIYEPEYESKEVAAEKIRELSAEMAGEGVVLLKNEQDALPIRTPQSDNTITQKPKISVFGKNSVNMVYGGSGSGGRDASSVVNLYDALAAEGFEYNTTLKQFYESSASGTGRYEGAPSMGSILTGLPTFETPMDSYNDSVKESYSAFNDAAIIVITRIGGEGYDLPRTMRRMPGKFADIKDYAPYSNTKALTDQGVIVEGAKHMDDHYLELDQNEINLINEVCADTAFNKVIILINSGTQMELGFLDDPGHPAYNDKIKSALWIGNPGGNGNIGVCRALSGAINPSGRLVATYSRDFKKDPSWNNFGNNNVEKGDEYYLDSWGNSIGGYFVRYEEGIYVGYRYYETRGYDERDIALTNYPMRGTSTTDWRDWHHANVVYPFGHGQSYTDFTWDLDSISIPDGETLSEDSVITAKIKVTNVGDTAGKDVVQMYYSAPFTGIDIDSEKTLEKSHVVLGDFAKTKLIQPNGGHDIVELKLKVSDMASYDFNSVIAAQSGYVLESGSYTVSFARDSHQAWRSPEKAVTYSVLTSIVYANDTTTNYPVKNRFTQASTEIKQYLSRVDWDATFPKSPIDLANKDNSKNVLESSGDSTGYIIQQLTSHSVDRNYDGRRDRETGEYKTVQPWTVLDADMPVYGQTGSLQLRDMIGKSFEHDDWKTLIQQLTIDNMADLIGMGAFSTVALYEIGKPPTKEFDGPGGWVIGSFIKLASDDSIACFFPGASLIGSMWSKDLAYKFGRAIGEESIHGATLDDVDYTFAGWYAPGVNLQRSQFGGRNFEYYGEDPILTGMTAANVVAGAKEKGVYCFVKHFAVNDQEVNRSNNGLVTWLSEQSMREIYLKPFELTVKENSRTAVIDGQSVTIKQGGTTAIMSSFNRIGAEWAGCSYALLTEVLRNEWGFKGMVITDYNNGEGSYMDLDKMIRAGGDLNLFQSGWLSTAQNKLTATHVTAMQKASKNILYTIANSNAMDVEVGKRLMPMWELVMIIIFVAIFVCLAIWGFLVICRAFKVLMFKKKH